MPKFGKTKACFAGVLTLAALPATAQAGAMTSGDAEQVRKLEIMLMVSSLRCRTSEADFQPEYRAFSTRHVASLRVASATLRADLAKRHGAKGAKRALDRISVRMANRYGGGHPWLDCRQLKTLTGDLGKTADRIKLVAAAGYLLADRDRGNFVLASAR